MKKAKKMIAVFLAAFMLIEGQEMHVFAQEMQLETARGLSVKGADQSAGAQLNFNNVTKTFNVKDYGASTSLDDNYPAFQAALNAANTYQKSHAGEQCKVIIPSGTYKVKGAKGHGLIVYSNTWISAKGATIKRRSDYDWHLMQSQMKGKGYQVVQNVLIEGGVWDGQGKETKNPNTIFRFAHASNIAFKDCTIQNSFNAHMVELGGVRGFTAQGCTFKKYTQNQKELKKEAIQLDICNNQTIMPEATSDDSLCSNVAIIDNTFTDLYRAVGSHSAVVGLYYKNINISRNRFSDIKGKAINAYNYKNCTISDNTFTNCSEAIDFRAMSMEKKYSGSFYAPADGKKPKAGKLNANLVISRNTILKDTMSSHDSPEAAIRIFGAKVDKSYYNNKGKLVVPAGDYYIENIRIEKNSISAKANGICLGNVRTSTLKDNKISGCGKSGIQVADRCNLTISGGTSSKNAKSGILVEKNSVAKIKAAKIEGNTSTGINVLSGKIDVSDKCIVSGNKSHGISLTNQSKNCKITSATLKSNKGNGVVLNKKSSLTIENGTISSNKKNGVVVTDSTLTMKKTSVKSNTENGVGFSGSSKGTIIGNTIASNKKGGLVATGGSICIKSNVIENNKKSGISLGSTAKATSLEKNVLSNQHRNEIIVSGAAKAPVRTTISVKVDPVKSSSKKITGVAHPKMKVTAEVGSKKIGTATVKSNGKYSMTIKKQKKNTSIIVYVKDSKGNILQRTVKVS